jgi:hypothetical protein
MGIFLLLVNDFERERDQNIVVLFDNTRIVMSSRGLHMLDILNSKVTWYQISKRIIFFAYSIQYLTIYPIELDKYCS